MSPPHSTKTTRYTPGLFDVESGEEYALHRVVAAQGAFIGRVCTEYEATLAEIAAACF